MPGKHWGQVPPQKETPRFLGVLGLGALPLLGGGGGDLGLWPGPSDPSEQERDCAKKQSPFPHLLGEGAEGMGG